MELIRKTRIEVNKNGYKIRYGIFWCDNCLQEIEKQISNGLRDKFCGKCKIRGYKHGGTYTNLYNVWCNMKARILNFNHKSYKDYGGRGITICDEWANDYTVFRDWSLSNGYAEGLQIDRWPNNDGNYEPSNCRFVTSQENNRNKRPKKFKLSIEIRDKIRELYATGNYTQKELAKLYNTNQTTISEIVNNKRW